MPPHALLSSERTDWQTPPSFLELVRAVGGSILIDPATSPDNPTGALVFGSQWDLSERAARHVSGSCVGDGLRVPWAEIAAALRRDLPLHSSGLAFWNPPYGAHLSGPIEPEHEIWRKDRATGERTLIGVGRGWAAKYAQEARAGLESIALVPVRTDAEWWETMMSASACALLWRSPTLGARISFVSPDTGRPVQGSNLASTVFYSGPNLDRFREVFEPHGRLIT